MKKLFTYCLAILFSTSLISQSSNESKKHIDNGNQLKEKWDNKKKFDPFFEMDITYQMNSNSLLNKNGYLEKLDSIVYEENIGGIWWLNLKKTFKYDNRGNIYEMYNFWWDDVKQKIDVSRQWLYFMYNR